MHTSFFFFFLHKAVELHRANFKCTGSHEGSFPEESFRQWAKWSCCISECFSWGSRSRGRALARSGAGPASHTWGVHVPPPWLPGAGWAARLSHQNNLMDRVFQLRRTPHCQTGAAGQRLCPGKRRAGSQLALLKPVLIKKVPKPEYFLFHITLLPDVGMKGIKGLKKN